MTHQDYVKRPQAPKKKKNAPTANKNEAPQHQANGSVKNKFIVIIILIIVSATSYGLWLLKHDPKTKEPVKIEAKEENKKTEKAIPKPPKEKWAYRDALENKEIEVGEYQIKDRGPYKMQCGSFRTLKQAQVLKANIAFTGIEAAIQQSAGKNGTWYKVVLGPYERKRAAEKDKHKLKNNNVNYCQIWLWK